MEIAAWAPLLVDGRSKGEPLAATRFAQGTDVDFGALSRSLVDHLAASKTTVFSESRVTAMKRSGHGWKVSLRSEVGYTPTTLETPFVFVGAGGMSLNLLQKTGIKEIRGYGGFPVSGVWMRSDNPEVARQHQAKVYGKASVGAPPMSVPHLDTRVVEGETSVLFGPYAGFTPKFLKNGSWSDFFASIRWHNLIPLVAVGLGNFSLVRYLVGEVFASRAKKLQALWDFYPLADPDDWYEQTAGQRVQVIKPDSAKGGVLQFGTEVITSADGSMSGLLGASPGASTAAPIMLTLLERCFPARIEGWTPGIRAMVPSYGTELSSNKALAAKNQARTAKALGLSATKR
jgi:malate dehydrogenase (quinone)